ncbi:MAG: phage portal protein [Boseongicola sp. SB0677_bin_26]|nr:phage portal protein [Boseongicola sp. SB0677_bin_26]
MKPRIEPTLGSPKRERRSGGGYTDDIVAAIEGAAARKTADVASTAAVEAAAGALSRAFASAEVIGPGWARDAVTPPWLAQVGRSLIREGASLSVVEMAPTGVLGLIPAAYWNFEGHSPRHDESEDSWRARVTTYGPSSSRTRLLDREQLVYLRWGTSPGTRYRGQGPTSWASLSAKATAETERSLGDEAGGPIAQFLPIPEDGGDDDGDGDPLAALKSDVGTARGRALFVETTSAGWGQGRANAPGNANLDWKAQRLGPSPPAALVELADAAFARMLAACGCPPGLFESNADGTSQREALRRWHLGTVEPMAKLLAHELSLRLEADVSLRFDAYPKDMAGRAQTFQKLVAGGLGVNEALSVSGLLAEDAA